MQFEGFAGNAALKTALSAAFSRAQATIPLEAST